MTTNEQVDTRLPADAEVVDTAVEAAVIEAYAQNLRDQRDTRLTDWRDLLDHAAARRRRNPPDDDSGVRDQAATQLHTAIGLGEALHQLYEATGGRFGDHNSTQRPLFHPTYRPGRDEDRAG
ncbi:hypothetical protein [Saccharothrix sp. HUAS TT1]|uniref:hypothetical protein n=1 Tax=unclassified Saccharothrix TaxID=2593673 RepID=UPI00345BE35A